MSLLIKAAKQELWARKTQQDARNVFGADGPPLTELPRWAADSLAAAKRAVRDNPHATPSFSARTQMLQSKLGQSAAERSAIAFLAADAEAFQIGAALILSESGSPLEKKQILEEWKADVISRSEDTLGATTDADEMSQREALAEQRAFLVYDDPVRLAADAVKQEL